MANSGKVTSGPYWTQNWIEAMWRFTSERFVNFDTGAVDYEALGREEYEFRKALFYRNFKNSPRAKTVFDEAAADYNKKVQNGSKGGRPKKSNGDADTREGSYESATVSTNIDDAIGGLAAELCAGANDSSRVKSANVAGSHKTGKAPVRIPAPRDKHEVLDFAEDNGLDVEDARLWYERNYVERPGCDKDGEVIRNWRGALINACKADAARRGF